MSDQEENWKMKLWKLVDAHQKEIVDLRTKLAQDLMEVEDKLTKDFSDGIKKAVADFNTTMETITGQEVEK